RTGQRERKGCEETFGERGAALERTGGAPPAVPHSRVLQRNLQREKLLEREPAPRRLRVLRSLGEMNLGERLRELGERLLPAPLERNLIRGRGRGAARIRHAGAQPELGDSLPEAVDRRDPREIPMLGPLFVRLELRIMHLEAAERLHRPGKEVALPRPEQALHKGLVEPHDAQGAGPVLNGTGHVASPPHAPLEADAGESAQNGGFLVRTKEGDRRDRAAVEVASGHMEEEISNRADFELGQAPGHFGADTGQVADWIAERGHRHDARGHSVAVSNGLPAGAEPARLGRSRDPEEVSWPGHATSAARAIRATSDSRGVNRPPNFPPRARDLRARAEP